MRVLVLLALAACISSAAAGRPSLDDAIASAGVVMFYLPSCPFCKRAEAALRKAGVEYNKIPIGPYKQALKSKTGKGSAPSMWIWGEFVGGCMDGTLPWHGVLPMLDSGRFQKMAAAGQPPSPPPPPREPTEEEQKEAARCNFHPLILETSPSIILACVHAFLLTFGPIICPSRSGSFGKCISIIVILYKYLYM